MDKPTQKEGGCWFSGGGADSGMGIWLKSFKPQMIIENYGLFLGKGQGLQFRPLNGFSRGPSKLGVLGFADHYQKEGFKKREGREMVL